jgi:gas vesicle protein
MSKKSSKWVLGAFIAGVAGFIGGVLAAPKSGKETREDIKDTANKLVSEAEKELKTVHSEIGDLIKKVSSTVSSKKGTAKKEVDTALDAAMDKQAKLKELLSAVRDGGAAENPDLQKALKEAKSALSHLKKFIK